MPRSFPRSARSLQSRRNGTQALFAANYKARYSLSVPDARWIPDVLLRRAKRGTRLRSRMRRCRCNRSRRCSVPQRHPPAAPVCSTQTALALPAIPGAASECVRPPMPFLLGSSAGKAFAASAILSRLNAQTEDLWVQESVPRVRGACLYVPRPAP